MKRYISIFLVCILITIIFCGCAQANPERATCTVTAANGFAGIYCAFQNRSNASATYLAIEKPLRIEIDEPGTVSYKFVCPACKCNLEGTLPSPGACFLRCDCETGAQAFAICVTPSKDFVQPTLPQYEAES